MLLRFVKLLIRTNRQVEDARQTLYCHKTFTMEEAFRLFDINENGKLTQAEISHVFSENGIELGDNARLVELLDLNGDETVNYDEWCQALKPRRPVQGPAGGAGNLTLEQRNLFQRAWLEQLAALFGQMIQVDAEINEKRNQLQLDGERLFADMDRHNMGYISVNAFANWVCDNCGFHIDDADLPGLEKALDGQQDYRIMKQGFIETVSVPADDEEEDEG